MDRANMARRARASRTHPPERASGTACELAGDWGAHVSTSHTGRKAPSLTRELVLLALVRDMRATIEDFLPNIANCALQDYGRLNDVLIRSSKALTEMCTEEGKAVRVQAVIGTHRKSWQIVNAHGGLLRYVDGTKTKALAEARKLGRVVS